LVGPAGRAAAGAIGIRTGERGEFIGGLVLIGVGAAVASGII
jgi:hypothetical protein